jgi:multidrug efflux pump subunit AcrA (membrane-fusion protein)
MKKSSVVTIVIAVCIAALLVLIAASFLPSKNEASDGETAADARPQGGERTASVVRVAVVEPGTIESSVVINGDVLARNQVSIFPTVGGRLAESHINIGDRVSQGQVVAMVDPSRPGEIFSRSPVLSTVSGTVLQMPFSVGDTVTTQSTLFVVGDLSSLRVETFVPERFVSAIRFGLRAQVSLEAIPGEVFFAEIAEISPVLDPASRTQRIRLRFVNSQGSPFLDRRIRAGMFATLSLVTLARKDVPIIPRTAVIQTYGSWIVFIADEDNIARRRELELGIENEDVLEVVQGLHAGDRVIVQGQSFLSDGDPVRIVE